METNIRDMEIYLYRMQRSILDKLFFLDKIFEQVDTVVDFGCANGELIKALKYFSMDSRYVGYDISHDMIEAARKNVPDADFYEEWDAMDVDFSRSLLNISSTLHEVYSYGTEADVAQFWDCVFDSGFRYVTIRDMMVSEAIRKPADPARIDKVRSNPCYARQLRDYEQCWGTISTEKELVHYLLKYSYTQNWDREVRENYLPISLEALLDRVPDSYEITYQRHYTLPYIAWQVQRDHGISLKTPTHVKLILKRK